MDEYPQGGVVYYFDHGRLALNRLGKKVEKIDNQIEEAKDDIALIQAARDALERVEAVLLKMKGLAVEASRSDCPNRADLDREYQGLKLEVEAAIRGAERGGVNLLNGITLPDSLLANRE